ncbi:WXG100 family type VII secretion target [Streptomyces oryzae]|uniref:WXG100 family type VII secretion target n=1 Tax=Streptomyces oryzae TaxID=1434886 RepID=A0ABS3X4M8_9ACTN|nr:WXG100 family type VII secretion target [Streptomyces oryzae]MBO8190330.1 WXG100 family type VII secretion target [Streptomyces oryzae]
MCADYDYATLHIAPNDLKSKKDRLVTTGQEISDALGRISDTLSALRLEWRGKSAQRQQEISDEWERVFGELFGTKDKPDTGVLSALANAVHNAAKNYAEVENGAADIFDRLLFTLMKQDINQATAEYLSQGTPNPDETYQKMLTMLQGETPPLEDQDDAKKSAIFTDYPNV